MEISSTAQRQQRYRQKRRESGLVYRSYWAKPETHELIKQLLEQEKTQT